MRGSVRLNKFISETGMCSRREADRYIEQGNVLINGRKAVVGDQVNVGDRVQVNGNDLAPRRGEDIVFIALNKPVGITSTTERVVRGNIVQFVNHSKRIFPIGRLDKDSQGLIFLTNHGDMVNKILRAGNKHEKEYVVTVNKPLTDEVIKGMAKGVPMLGVTTKKCKIVQEGTFTFRIILTQGLNRQIRRMCQHFGYEVNRLERVRIMNIDLKGLSTGDWRDLTESEMNTIYKMVEGSSSEDVKKPKSKPAYKKISKGKKGEGLSPENIPGSSSPSLKNPSKKREGKSKIPHKTGRNNRNKPRNAEGNSSRKPGGRKSKR